MKSQNVIKTFGAGLMPIPRLAVSEWADNHRYLSAVSSAEPGKYRTSRTPYLRRIMDCLSSFETFKKIVFMKGAQIGATESGSNFIGYTIDIDPAPMMYVMPTEKMAERFSKTRVDTLIDLCPTIKEKVAANKSRDKKNTIMEKSFHGGVLLFAGANSAAGLRSVPIKKLVLDEVDAYPADLDEEGSPVELAIARTRTFPNKKIFLISTPTISGASVIEQEFLETDQNYFYVPCPHCGVMQKLVFSRLVWEEGKPKTAKYQCGHCDALIEERYKVKMFADGQWTPEAPERVDLDTIGFHLSSLYSPYGWQSWAEIATDFLKAKDNPVKLKVFVNTTLGEPWTEKGEAPPYKNLYNRREHYRLNTIPDGVCFLTSGVDVQKDRLELEIVGWCADKRSYSIDYRVLEGDPANTHVWDLLSDVLSEHWLRSDGVEFGIKVMCIDTGYQTTEVYNFCRKYTSDRVIPIKGQDSLGVAVSNPKTIDIKKDGKRTGKVRLWHLGVSTLKADLYGYLRLEKDSNDIPPPNYCHFPEYPEHYFRGLTAEVLIRKRVKSSYAHSWKKVYERNEPLDCRIYARAAATIVGLDRFKPEKLEAMAGKGIAGEKKSRKPKKRGGYFDRD